MYNRIQGHNSARRAAHASPQCDGTLNLGIARKTQHPPHQTFQVRR